MPLYLHAKERLPPESVIRAVNVDGKFCEVAELAWFPSSGMSDGSCVMELWEDGNSLKVMFPHIFSCGGQYWALNGHH